ncbi:MAG: CoA-transferase subunit beta, partial [Acidimicrobiia bacterium]
LKPHADTHELILAAIHPGVELDKIRDTIGWDVKVGDDLVTTDPPTFDELSTLRDLKARTAQAHSR